MQYYCNVPKFSDRQVWANGVDSDQTAPDQGLHLFRFKAIIGDIPSTSVGSITLVKPPCLNFRVIVINVSGVLIFSQMVHDPAVIQH